MDIFGTTTVASITASLGKMVTRLEQHAEEMAAKALKHGDTVLKYARLRDEAQDEISKAKAAAQKIGALFS